MIRFLLRQDPPRWSGCTCIVTYWYLEIYVLDIPYSRGWDLYRRY